MLMKGFKALAMLWAAVAGGSLVTTGILLFVSARPAHTQPPIQITSPSTGIRVGPGAPLTVVVTLGPGISVSQMTIAAEDPIGISDFLTAPPFQFPLTIPTVIRPGLYHLTADGFDSQGQKLQSNSIIIDVEPSVSITGLEIRPGILNLRFPGDQAPIRVIGTTAAGGQIDLTYSTLITYSTTNSSVSTVSINGVVTAVGPGRASISVSGPATPFAIPVFVPNNIRGDLNGDGRVDTDDINILREALNTPSLGPFDARDLNGDGIINALDARLLVSLCTKPGCATH